MGTMAVQADGKAWGIGGKGAKVEGEISLGKGFTLFISIGHEGYQSSTDTAFGGGGTGNPRGYYQPEEHGWTGGGKSVVATAVNSFDVAGNDDNIIFVAGGGGGCAGSNATTYWFEYAADGGS